MKHAMNLEREVVRTVSAKQRAERRIKLALKRIAKLPTMDDPDAMIECISDVEALLKGERLP